MRNRHETQAAWMDVTTPDVAHDGVRAPVTLTKGASGGELLPAGTPRTGDMKGSETPPTRIVHVPASDSTSGTQRLSVLNVPGVYPKELSRYETHDGVPRKATVIVAPGPIYLNATGASTGTRQSALGVYARITFGGLKGAVSQWVAAPCIFPCEGSFIRVEGIIAALPYSLLNNIAGAPQQGGSPQVVIGALSSSGYSCQLQSLVLDGWTDLGAPQILCNGFTPSKVGAKCGLAAGPQLTLTSGGYNPAIIDSIVFTNMNAAAAVQMYGMDGPIASGISTDYQRLGGIWVPAQSTVSVGKALLGAWFSNVILAGVTGPPDSNVEDLNDANVYATIYGRMLSPSQSG